MKNNRKRAMSARKLINAGATWDESSKKIGLSQSRTQMIVRNSYVNAKSYKNLLEKAKNNQEEKNSAKRTLLQKEREKERKEILVVETGYLLAKGSIAWFHELEIVVPEFCIAELEKLSSKNRLAEEILLMYWAGNIEKIKIEEEILYEEPLEPIKSRIRGIVSTCVELDSRGYEVRLLTNSKQVKKVAQMQGSHSIKVEMI